MVRDSLLACLLFLMPNQRGVSIMCMQIVRDEDTLWDPAGNYIFYKAAAEKWRCKLNKHKNAHKYAIPAFDFPSESLTVKVLEQWSGWAEEVILTEKYGCPAVECTEGRAFLTVTGLKYESSSWRVLNPLFFFLSTTYVIRI